MESKTVLVTGGSGFVGSHCIVQLLKAGYNVNTTVRNLARENEVRTMVKRGGILAGDRLKFFASDLTADLGWREAVAGCTYVLHVASPFLIVVPKDENELIIPAREGTLRVLRASRDAGVKRVVVTSSFVAVGYGHEPRAKPFTETDWTNLEGDGVNGYAKSKTLAEKAAWDFIKQEGNGLELSVVNPVGIFGPALGTDISPSMELVTTRIAGRIPSMSGLTLSVIDVEDLAVLHLLAMENPKANNERFLAVGDGLIEAAAFAQILQVELATLGQKTGILTLPDWLIRFSGLFMPQMKVVANQLGKKTLISNQKAQQMLGWRPRSNEETLRRTARSLVELGLFK